MFGEEEPDLKCHTPGCDEDLDKICSACGRNVCLAHSFFSCNMGQTMHQAPPAPWGELLEDQQEMAPIPIDVVHIDAHTAQTHASALQNLSDSTTTPLRCTAPHAASMSAQSVVRPIGHAVISPALRLARRDGLTERDRALILSDILFDVDIDLAEHVFASDTHVNALLVDNGEMLEELLMSVSVHDAMRLLRDVSDMMQRQAVVTSTNAVPLPLPTPAQLLSTTKIVGNLVDEMVVISLDPKVPPHFSGRLFSVIVDPFKEIGSFSSTADVVNAIVQHWKTTQPASYAIVVKNSGLWPASPHPWVMELVHWSAQDKAIRLGRCLMLAIVRKTMSERAGLNGDSARGKSYETRNLDKDLREHRNGGYFISIKAAKRARAENPT